MRNCVALPTPRDRTEAYGTVFLGLTLSVAPSVTITSLIRPSRRISTGSPRISTTWTERASNDMISSPLRQRSRSPKPENADAFNRIFLDRAAVQAKKLNGTEGTGRIG